MRRRAHLLKPNTRLFRPIYHIFFDVETWVGEYVHNWAVHTFRLGWALFWRKGEKDKKDTLEWYSISDVEEFWEWVESKVKSKKRVIVVSHNLNYDLIATKALIILPSRGWELTKLFLTYSCSILSFRKKSKTILFLDNTNWFKGHLEEWGEVVGYPKKKVDSQSEDTSLVSDYCKRDVEILYHLWRWWYSFIDEHDLGSWGVTLPSQAFLSFRHRFMPHKVYIHIQEQPLKLERLAYHGGRVECFRVGVYEGESFFKVDVNSMYPYVMKVKEYPLQLKGYSGRRSIKSLRRILSQFCAVARVKVSTDKPCFPLMIDRHLAYPEGEFETVLTTGELSLALENGWVESVEEVAWYEKGVLFKEYVDYFYNLKEGYREGGNRVCFHLSKLMLNSLYGKFGQKATLLESIGSCDPQVLQVVKVYNIETGERSFLYYLGGKVYHSVPQGEAYNSFPAIAAHVTAYARLYLWQLIEAAGRENVYYCDTDSLILNEEGYKRFQPFIREEELGMLKVEGVADFLSISAPKDYTFGDIQRVKGVREDAVWLDDRTVEQEVFPSIRGILRTGNPEEYKTKKIIKVLSRTIFSGEVDKEGNVHPFKVEILEKSNLPW